MQRNMDMFIFRIIDTKKWKRKLKEENEEPGLVRRLVKEYG